MASRREDLHHLRGHLGDPAAGHLARAAGDVELAAGALERSSVEAPEDRRDGRRRRLAEAALELFSTRGFDHTSVDDIVAAGRTSKSAFYEFWSSREDCLRDLLGRVGDDLLGAVAGEAALSSEQPERLRRGLAEFVRGCLRNRREARLLLVESVGVSGPVEDLRQQLQDRFARLAEADARRPRADAREVEPALFGRAVVGATQQATAQLILEPEPDPEAVIRGLCAIFAPLDRASEAP